MRDPTSPEQESSAGEEDAFYSSSPFSPPDLNELANLFVLRTTNVPLSSFLFDRPPDPLFTMYKQQPTVLKMDLPRIQQEKQDVENQTVKQSEVDHDDEGVQRGEDEHEETASEKQQQQQQQMPEQSEQQEQKFLPSLFYARYKWTGEWLLCRIRSIDIDSTVTVVWYDGFLQIGTSSHDLVALRVELADALEAEIETVMEHHHHQQQDYCTENQILSSAMINVVLPEPFQYKGMDVWEAAKQGNLEACLAIIDQGHATPNDVELFNTTTDNNNNNTKTLNLQHGRTPLYWACFTGHVDLVRELLARGGIDHDGAAYLSITTREQADDNRDILFDPDTNTFSDFVDYDDNSQQQRQRSKNNEAMLKNDSQSGSAGPSEHDAVLIRTMLLAAKMTSDKRSKSILRRLPKQLYQSTMIPSSTTTRTNNKNKGFVTTKQDSSVSDTSVATTESESSSSSSSSSPVSATSTEWSKNCCNSNNKCDDNEAKGRSHDDNIMNSGNESNNNDNDCVICLEQSANAIPVPCGHIACCLNCLTKVYRQRDGCPICRGSIAAVLPLQSVLSYIVVD